MNSKFIILSGLSSAFAVRMVCTDMVATYFGACQGRNGYVVERLHNGGRQYENYNGGMLIDGTDAWNAGHGRFDNVDCFFNCRPLPRDSRRG